MQYKDYYEILGVAKDATSQEVQRAYRALARRYHPDVNKDPSAEDRFKEIGEAYEALGDAEKRKKYDRYGSAWQRVQAGNAPPPGWEDVRFDFGGEEFDLGSSGFSSFFEMLFGDDVKFSFSPGGRTQRVRPNRPGRNLESTLRVSLDDLARGKRRQVELQDPTTGRRKTLQLTLPRGVLPGQRIRLAGQGEPGTDGRRGDLFLRLELEPHPDFALDGRNVRSILRISPWQAALGGKAEVPTLDGPVQIHLPARSSTGRRIRLKGKGLPNPSGLAGDLYIELQIALPEQTSEAEEALYRQLRELEQTEPDLDAAAS